MQILFNVLFANLFALTSFPFFVSRDAVRPKTYTSSDLFWNPKESKSIVFLTGNPPRFPYWFLHRWQTTARDDLVPGKANKRIKYIFPKQQARCNSTPLYRIHCAGKKIKKMDEKEKNSTLMSLREFEDELPLARHTHKKINKNVVSLEKKKKRINSFSSLLFYNNSKSFFKVALSPQCRLELEFYTHFARFW